ncbi:MAG: hypothetical protein CM1200mP41_12050 [Gammaproteobacteria bacterium]|nr:MAG: hypothetical protein CM1200mP41_12050 [Gammaproteobacteria bacterium]
MTSTKYTLSVTKFPARKKAGGKSYRNRSSDPIHEQLEPLAYFVWAIRNSYRTIIVDTGFDQKEADGRREASGNVWTCDFRHSPAAALSLIDIDSRKVKDVVVTHLHYDHAGTYMTFQRPDFICKNWRCNMRLGPHMAQRFFSGRIRSTM